MVGRHSLSFSDDEIVDICEHSELKTKLNAIEDVVEDKDHIFIYISAMSALIIPNRVFASEEHKQDFLKMLRDSSSCKRL